MASPLLSVSSKGAATAPVAGYIQLTSSSPSRTVGGGGVVVAPATGPDAAPLAGMALPSGLTSTLAFFFAAGSRGATAGPGGPPRRASHTPLRVAMWRPLLVALAFTSLMAVISTLSHM